MMIVMGRSFFFGSIVVLAVASMCSSSSATTTTTTTSTSKLSPDQNEKASFSLRRTSVAVEEEVVAVAVTAVTAVVDAGITNSNEGDAVRFLESKVCEDQESCKKCFNANPICSWTIVSDRSGNSAGSCSSDPCTNTTPTNTDGRRSLSLILCGHGVSVEEKNTMNKKVWKKENKMECKKLQDLVPTRPSKTCRDRSGDCVDCLKSTTSTKQNNDEECVWVPEANSCEIDCFQIFDTSCVAGSLPKKEAKKECKVLQKQRENRNKCERQSDCTDCVDTTFQQYQKQENGNYQNEEASCQWFPANGFFFDDNNLEGRCDSVCNRFGCGVPTTTCPLPITLKPDTNDEDEDISIIDVDGDGGGGDGSDSQYQLDIRNNKECASKGINCQTCRATVLMEHEGVAITPPRTCQWYPDPVVEEETADVVLTIDGGTSRSSGGGCLDRCYDSTQEKYNRDIECTAIKYVTTCAAADDVDGGGGGDGEDEDEDEEEDGPNCSDFSGDCRECYESGCTFLNESQPKECVAYADTNCPVVEPTDGSSCVGWSDDDGVACNYGYAITGCSPDTFTCTPSVQYTCNNRGTGVWERDFLMQIMCTSEPMVPDYGQACNPEVYTPTGSIIVGGFESEIERTCFEYEVNDQNYETCEVASTGGTCDSCVETLLDTIPGINYFIAPTCHYFLDTGVCAPTSCVFTGSGEAQDCSGTMFCPDNDQDTLLPLPDTSFPEYGPPFKEGVLLTGKVVHDLLFSRYPGLTKIDILEDGSMVTMDYLESRVRIFVEKTNGTNDEVDIENRLVAQIPQVG